jgi:hypothetical protein
MCANEMRIPSPSTLSEGKNTNDVSTIGNQKLGEIGFLRANWKHTKINIGMGC